MHLDKRLRKDLSPDIYCLVHNKIVNLEQQCKKQKEVTDKLKRYINGCLEVSPIEDRSVTDDVLDKEFKYLLKILKEGSE